MPFAPSLPSVATHADDIRFLVVEDSVEDRELLLWQLRKIGIAKHIKFIADGRDAVNYLATLPPREPLYDLMAIFLDLRLPSMSGIEVLKEIKTMPRYKTIPVIVMTSSIDPKDAQECERLHVDGFISKPITFKTFSQVVSQCVQLPSA